MIDALREKLEQARRDFPILQKLLDGSIRRADLEAKERSQPPPAAAAHAVLVWCVSARRIGLRFPSATEADHYLSEKEARDLVRDVELALFDMRHPPGDHAPR